MATAAPFVKLLRQLSNAKDEYRSGALDLTWDGGSASIYVVFGQPNHALYDTEAGEHLEGADALAALVHHLPRRFKVAPWRKEVVRVESLQCTMEELVGPFAQLAGAAPEVEQETQDDLSVVIATEDVAPVHIRLDTFPLLPLGEAIWTEASAKMLQLDVMIPNLPTALVILTGAKLRAAAVLIRGSVVDALWVDDEGAAAGEGAATAIIGAREGSLSAYKLEDATVAEALTMLWRAPQAFAEIPLAWLDSDRLLQTIERERRDRVLLVQTPAQRGVGMFMGGHFVATYTEQQRQPVADIDVLRSLLGSGEGTLTVLQRVSDHQIKPVSEATYHLRGDDLDAARGAVVSVPAEPSVAAAVSEGAEPAIAGAVAGTQGEPESAPPPEDIAATIAPWHDEAAASDGATPAPQQDGYGAAAENGEAVASAAAAAWAVDPPPPPPPPGWAPAEPYAAPPAAPGWDAASQVFAAPEAVRAAPEAVHAEPVAVHAAPEAVHAQPEAFHVEPEAVDTTGEAASVSGWGAPSNYEPVIAAEDLPVDFNAIKQDLIQMGARWLGSDDVVPVALLIEQTRNEVDAFVATIERVKTTPVAGHDPSVIRAMAREMHYYAAEALCGA